MRSDIQKFICNILNFDEMSDVGNKASSEYYF